jgi:hypothetical protein
VRQKIGLNFNGVERIGPRQTEIASAFGAYNATKQGPSTGREAKPCTILGT